jgi:hypothetical protein
VQPRLASFPAFVLGGVTRHGAFRRRKLWQLPSLKRRFRT